MEKVDKTSDVNAIEHELHSVESELHHFEERQTGVTRTLQMIVYPAMVAFIILSAYGFYLVQSLTTDVHELTKTIASMQQSVDSNMGKIAGTMTDMNGQMTGLVASMNQMTHNIVDMNDSTQSMAGNIQQMNASTQNMAVSTYNMQRDMWNMNKNISGPMKLFNSFNPFDDERTAPYVVPPPVYAPYYHYGWTQPAQSMGALPQQPSAAPTASQPAPAAGPVQQQSPATLPQQGSGTAQDQSALPSPSGTLVSLSVNAN